MIAQLLAQFGRLLRFHVLLYITPAIIILGTVILSRKLAIPLFWFTEDTSGLGLVHPFAGIVSNLGVIVWCSSAAFCFMSWSILRRREEHAAFACFLLCAGLMSTLLLFDDFFVFHEMVFPEHLGINEKVVQLSYVALILIGIIVFRATILETDYLILLFALGFFGLSVFIDLMEDPLEALVDNWVFVLEDGAKLCGIFGWCGYFFRCGVSRMSPA